MEPNYITDFIQKGQDALIHGDNAFAKNNTNKAIAGAKHATDRFLSGEDETISEQQLADWYGGCSFISSKIGENYTATRCFYTAIIFDQEWNFQNHLAVSDILWDSLVYSHSEFSLSLNIQKILDLLEDLDNMAKLAERRKKWSVCVAIDGDIDQIYNVMKDLGFLHQELITLPNRKSAMWRTARCYLELNFYEEVQKVCYAILQHICDYDDSDALSIWARSLYKTGDFDQAFEKNELALKYCNESVDKDKLEAFKTEIEKKLTETAIPKKGTIGEEWSDKTHNDHTSAVEERHQSTREKKRRRKPKQRPQHKGSGMKGSRSRSAVRSDTEGAKMSHYSTKTSYEYSMSESGLDDDASISNASVSRPGYADMDLVVEKDIKIDSTKRGKGVGEITASFSTHKSATDLPLIVNQTSADERFSVETEKVRTTERNTKMLFGAKDTLASMIALNKPIPDLDRDHTHTVTFIERDLYYDASSDDKRRVPLPSNNAKQQEAINNALTSRFSLIQAPPGTGKTYTAIKLISLFNKVNDIRHKEGKPKKQVLFCGHSNRSVDLFAECMSYRLGNYCPDFVRVYDEAIEAYEFPIPGRSILSERSTPNEKPSPVLCAVALHHLIRQNGAKYAEEFNALDKLFKENKLKPLPKEVATYDRLVREACIDEIKKHEVILCTTAVWSNRKELKAASVCQVIIDDAGRCTEQQCMELIIATKAEQVVLIGDHKQLKPNIMYKEPGFIQDETSLFERYAGTDTKYANNIKFTMMEEQYQMNPQICCFPSKQFYNGALKTKNGLWTTRQMDIWPKDKTRSFPHILVHVAGEEKSLTVVTEDGFELSISNAAEIDEAVKLYSYITREQPNEHVHIISQYTAQVSEIKRRLKEEGYVDEYVSTVVESQEEEWNYVIFSTVRSLPGNKMEQNPTLDWCKHYLGMLTDQNQVNVALTRARRGLIIIGNKDLLSCEQFVWKKLVNHYQQRDCVKAPGEFPPLILRSRRQIMEESMQRYYESINGRGATKSCKKSKARKK